MLARGQRTGAVQEVVEVVARRVLRQRHGTDVGQFDQADRPGVGAQDQHLPVLCGFIDADHLAPVLGAVAVDFDCAAPQPVEQSA